MLLRLEDLHKEVQQNPSLKIGCIVDTNLLFAATFLLDTFNEWAESVFQNLNALGIPVFTNMNVRSEFIELNRRVLLPEGLVEMYAKLTGTLHPEMEQQLKSLKTMKDKAAKENQTFRLNDVQIKKYKKLLSRFSFDNGENAWDTFCAEYFLPYIKVVWDEAVSSLKLNFLGTREIESGEHFVSRPRWQDMLEIVGRTGIGTADAMIVNLFEKSTLPIMITADGDVRDAVISVVSGRYIVAPQCQ